MQCSKLSGRLGWHPCLEDLQEALLSSLLAMAICVPTKGAKAGLSSQHTGLLACMQLSVIELEAPSHQGL